MAARRLMSISDWWAVGPLLPAKRWSSAKPMLGVAGSIKTKNAGADFKLGLTCGMPAKLPPLESLRVLEACVRHQNMTRAAAELGVTPAAVSLRIRDLEAELRTPLFIRAGPRISATAEAKLLGAEISTAIARIEDAVAACRRAKPQIRITSVPTLASRWLAGALTEYQRLNPAADVVVDSTELVRPKGSFDLALRHGAGKWPSMVAHRILGGEATPMIAPALANEMRTPVDLARLPLVPDSCWHNWFQPFGVSLDEARFTVAYPSQELAAAAVVAGAGAALLSPVLFAAFVAEGRLVRPFDRVVDGGKPYFLVVGEDERRPGVLGIRDFLIAYTERERAGAS